MPLVCAPTPIPAEVIWEASSRARCVTWGNNGTVKSMLQYIGDVGHCFCFIKKHTVNCSTTIYGRTKNSPYVLYAYCICLTPVHVMPKTAIVAPPSTLHVYSMLISAIHTLRELSMWMLMWSHHEEMRTARSQHQNYTFGSADHSNHNCVLRTFVGHS